VDKANTVMWDVQKLGFRYMFGSDYFGVGYKKISRLCHYAITLNCGRSYIFDNHSFAFKQFQRVFLSFLGFLLLCGLFFAFHS